MFPKSILLFISFFVLNVSVAFSQIEGLNGKYSGSLPLKNGVYGKVPVRCYIYISQIDEKTVMGNFEIYSNLKGKGEPTAFTIFKGTHGSKKIELRNSSSNEWGYNIVDKRSNKSLGFIYLGDSEKYIYLYGYPSVNGRIIFKKVSDEGFEWTYLANIGNDNKTEPLQRYFDGGLIIFKLIIKESDWNNVYHHYIFKTSEIDLSKIYDAKELDVEYDFGSGNLHNFKSGSNIEELSEVQFDAQIELLRGYINKYFGGSYFNQERNGASVAKLIPGKDVIALLPNLEKINVFYKPTSTCHWIITVEKGNNGRISTSIELSDELKNKMKNKYSKEKEEFFAEVNNPDNVKEREAAIDAFYGNEREIKKIADENGYAYFNEVIWLAMTPVNVFKDLANGLFFKGTKKHGYSTVRELKDIFYGTFKTEDIDHDFRMLYTSFVVNYSDKFGDMLPSNSVERKFIQIKTTTKESFGYTETTSDTTYHIIKVHPKMIVKYDEFVNYGYDGGLFEPDQDAYGYVLKSRNTEFSIPIISSFMNEMQPDSKPFNQLFENLIRIANDQPSLQKSGDKLVYKEEFENHPVVPSSDWRTVCFSCMEQSGFNQNIYNFEACNCADDVATKMANEIDYSKKEQIYQEFANNWWKFYWEYIRNGGNGCLLPYTNPK